MGWRAQLAVRRSGMRRIPKHMTERARRLRREMTDAERALWRLIGPTRPRFATQLTLGPYIVDFACRSVKLAVELDGSQHLTQTDYDRERTAFLARYGWHVIRFWNAEVLSNPEGAAEAVLNAVAERGHGA